MATSSTCIKRLKKEVLMLEKNPDDFITLSPNVDNIRLWSAIIRAPPDSVYDGYTFDVGIEVGSDYPLTPPTMKFLTKIFHPNVHYEVLETATQTRSRQFSCECFTIFIWAALFNADLLQLLSYLNFELKSKVELTLFP